MAQNTDPESIVREIKRWTRKKYSSEEKIRIVLEGPAWGDQRRGVVTKRRTDHQYLLRMEQGVFRRGKKRLQGDAVREAASTEVVDLKKTIS